MKKLMCFILACIFLVSVSSCAQTPSGTQDTNTGMKADTSDAEGKDEHGYEIDDLGYNLNYGGDTILILCWSDVERKEFEITEDEQSGVLVDDAIFKRNVTTEGRLNVNFEWSGTKGNNSHVNDFTSYVQRQQAAGIYYDLVATYSRTAGMMSTKGLLHNLNSIEDSHLNFSKPWWPSEMVDSFTIGDALYFCSGDISTNVLHFMYAVWYNMDMVKNFNIEDPIKLVDNKEWTISKLVELSKGLYEDSDNDGKASIGDRFGFCSEDYHLDAFYTGADMKLIVGDAEKTLKISEDFTSEKAVNLVDILGAFGQTADACIKDGKVGSMNYLTPFASGNALFCLNRVYIADTEHGCKLHDVSWEYGLLPVPMYDTNQKEYKTVLGNPITLWGLMSGQDYYSAERNSAVLECLASYGYRYTTPALFETNMKYKYTSGAENDGVRMFDIIHNGITFDLGRIFGSSLGLMSEMPSNCIAAGTSWKVDSMKYINILNNKLEQIVKNFNQLQ